MIYATNVKVCPENLALTVGKWCYDLCATVEPSNATCSCVQWVSSDSSIVSVNESTGYIFANSTGTAKIYAVACDCSGVYACCTVTVTEPILATGVNVLPTEAKLEVGASKVLRGIVLPTNATVQCLFWTTSNKNVVTVNPDTGLIYAVSPGTATIHATVCDASGAHGSCEVTVVPDSVPPTGIELDKTSLTLAIGGTAELKETVYPTEGAVKRAVHWTSSNPQVAEVNRYTGKITALSPGTTTITATTVVGNLSASCQLTVPQPPSWIKLSKIKLTLKVGEIKYLVAYVMSEDEVYGMNVRWSSSNSSIASVDVSNGKITALSPGTVTITATTPDGNLSSECTVRVIADTVTISAYKNTNKVVFDSTGKTWYCIYDDMVFDDEAQSNSANRQRLIFNSHVNIQEDRDNMREYTEDEIKLLYLIDPCGLAAYVKEYASVTNEGGWGGIGYKDYIFEVLFGRKPRYFSRNLDGVWSVARDTSEINKVMSESEMFFGGHLIFDAKTDRDLFVLVVDLASIIISPYFAGISSALQIAKTGLLVCSNKDVKGKFQICADSIMQKADLDDVSISWIYDLYGICCDIWELTEYLYGDWKHVTDMLSVCYTETHYDVYVEREDGNKRKASDLLMVE